MPEQTPKEKLLELLEAEGLELAEDLAVETVRKVFKLLPKIADIIPGQIDDMVVSIVVLAEPKILEMLDKIDGIDDPNY